MMKALFVVYAPAIESYIFDLMKELDIKKYTKFPDLHGAGGHSEPHLDTHIWPGSNSALFIVIDETKKQKFMTGLSKIKNDFLEEGIQAFVLSMEESL